MLYLAFFILLLAMYYNNLPCILNPVVWEKPSPLPQAFSIDSEASNILKGASHVAGDIVGPESFAIDHITGIVYASLNDGTVASFTQEGKYLQRVFFSAGVVYFNGASGNGINEKSKYRMEFCRKESAAKRLSWNVTAEILCGRPLGLRIIQDKESFHTVLFILDAYHGLFKLDIPSLTVHHLSSPSNHIESSSTDPDPLSLLPPRFYNDLDILPISGDIVFSDSSYLYSRSENRVEVLDGAPRGRLLRYSVGSKRVSVIACGLHFPNGVQAIDETHVLVGELGRFRVLSVSVNAVSLCNNCSENGSLYRSLQDKTSSEVQIFSDSVPGMIDNIRVDSKDPSLLWIGIGVRNTAPFSLLHWLLQGTMIRVAIGKLLPMRWVEYFLPRAGIVLAMDSSNGQIRAVLQDPSGKQVSWVSQASRHPITGDLWIGSHIEEYIAILPANELNRLSF